ncbi:MAG: hypothetical protein M3Z24_15640, partial [Chloroflexota bacterium]|nr:hypothetical protein [Chloroflexota bacterium]
QRGFLKASGVTEAREVREVLRADLPALRAADLPQHQRLDFHPFAPYQVDKGPIPTHHLFVCFHRHLGSLLLEAFLLRRAHRQCGLSCRQRRSMRGRLAHLHPQHLLEQVPRLFKRHPAR